MAFSLVQQASNFTFTTGQPSLTLGSNVTAGNLLVAWVSASSPTLPTLDDGGVNTWVPLTSGTATYVPVSGAATTGIQGGLLTGGYGAVTCWYAIAKLSRSITVKFYDTHSRNPLVGGAGGLPANLTTPACQIMEFTGNGTNPFDATAQGTGSSTAPQKAVTVTGSADLILGIPISSITAVTCVETAGWTNAAGVLTNFSAIYAVETGSGTFTPTFLLAPTGTWGVISVGFSVPGTLYTIAGALGAGGAGATVYFTSATTGIVHQATADGSGNYTSPSLANDTYTVQPQIIGAVFSPVSASAAVSGSNVTGKNFTATVVNKALVFTVFGSDTFHRANENPLNPAVWANDGGSVPPDDPPLQIVSNECVMSDVTIYNNLAGPNTGDGINLYIGTSVPRDQWEQIQLDAFLNNGWEQCFLIIQAPRNDIGGNFLLITNNGDGTVRMQAISISPASPFPTTANLWINPSVPFIAGDTFRLGSSNGILYIYHNGDLIGNYAAAPISGGPVIEVAGLSIPAVKISNFETGPVTASGVTSPIALVQEAGNFAFTSSFSSAIAYPIPVTLGNLLIVFATTTTSSISGVTDTLGNTWTQLGTTLHAGYGYLYAYYAIAKSTGATTVTMNGGSLNFGCMQVLEFFGQAPSSVVVATAQGISSGTTCSQSVVTGSANNLILGFGIVQGGGVFTAGAGWTQSASTPDVNPGYGAIYSTQSIAGTYTPTFTVAPSGATGMLAVAIAPNTSIYSISGNAGVGGATMTLTGTATVITEADASGNYSFVYLGNGSYTVTPSLGTNKFNPTSTNVTVSSANVTGINFTLANGTGFMMLMGCGS